MSTKKRPSRRRSKAIKLTWHKASGQWRKCIGSYIGRQGTVQPKHWYLGSDAGQAEIKALELLAEWKALKASGKKVWDHSPDFQSSASEAALNAQKPLTVTEASSRYLDELKNRATNGQVTESHYKSQLYRLSRAIEPLKKLPLVLVRESQLQQAVIALARRPHIAGTNETDDGLDRPISATYAKAAIKSLRWFFDWADERDFWHKPKSFKTIFKKIEPIVLDDELEKQLRSVDGGEPDHFSIDNLAKLYSKATDRLRLWMLLGLNCGFTTAELATLKYFEIQGIGTEKVSIARRRGKTGVYARWPLFPETAALLERAVADNHPNQLVFLTAEGQSLRHANAVGQAWSRLLDLARLETPLTFKYLRKTGAWLIQKEAGPEVAQMYLSQAETRMIRHYAGRDWDKLAHALELMRVDLLPVFETDPAKLEVLQKEAKQREMARKFSDPTHSLWQLMIPPEMG